MAVVLRESLSLQSCTAHYVIWRSLPPLFSLFGGRGRRPRPPARFNSAAMQLSQGEAKPQIPVDWEIRPTRDTVLCHPLLI